MKSSEVDLGYHQTAKTRQEGGADSHVTDLNDRYPDPPAQLTTMATTQRPQPQAGRLAGRLARRLRAGHPNPARGAARIRETATFANCLAARSPFPVSRPWLPC
eukprot:Selendium_serpulae@DN8185_c0_g1_i1.p1